MELQTFQVGIIFQSLRTPGSLWSFRSKTRGPPRSRGNIEKAALTHWILVFTASSGSHWAELVDQKGIITFNQGYTPYTIPAYYFATYTGNISDIYNISQTHPMNGTEYQQTINNCQHWTATFLYSLLNLANCTPYRYFEVFDQNILALILHVVNVQPNGVWHLQNEFIVTAVGVLAKLLA